MPRFFVRAVPNAGDLPYLEIGLGEMVVFMTSRKAGTFDLYRAMSPGLSPSQQRSTGVARQPSWAFLVSNGRDEVYLSENVGRPTCTVRCQGSDTEIHVELKETDARALATSLTSLTREASSKLTRNRNARIRPAGIAYTYHAGKQVLGFDGT